MTQIALETCRGVRLTVDPGPYTTKLELEVIVKLIDAILSERLIVEGADISDFTAELYSGRVHMIRAIREVSK